MRPGLFLALACLPLAGCASEEDGRSAQDRGSRAEAPAAAPLPHLILYRSADDGGPEVFMEALVGGTLDLRSPCVAVIAADDVSHAIVTTQGELGRDREGPFLGVGPHRFRHGDAVMSGGGFIGEAFPRADLLQSTVPEDCAGMPLVEMSFLYPAPPSTPPPLAPPPPGEQTT